MALWSGRKSVGQPCCSTWSQLVAAHPRGTHDTTARAIVNASGCG
ncbi:hypothetical protein [Mycobacterium bohemicum]|nr:hypothetical protein [Mycobacterium bohemicum]